MSKPDTTGARKWRVMIIVTAFLLVIAAATSAIGYTSRSDFCGSCHEMDSQFETWTQSAHQDVDCITCHVEPGFLNLMKHKIGSWKQVYEHFTNTAPENIELPEPISQEICLNCHQDATIENGMWEMIHQNHIERGAACSDCHRNSVHVKNPEEKNSMASCVKCHNN